MAAFKVRNLWTAFITAFFALLASVGLTTATTAAAVSQPSVQTPDEPAKARAGAARTTVPPQSRRASTGWLPAARDRSLLPTMKQRIGAEAHGASPSTRHLPALEADADADGTTEEAAPVAVPAASSPSTAAGTAARSEGIDRTARVARPVEAPVRSAYAVAA